MERNRREFLTGAAWMGVAAIDFPDYTRGGWKTAKPFAVDEIDMDKFDFTKGVTKDRDAQRT